MVKGCRRARRPSGTPPEPVTALLVPFIKEMFSRCTSREADSRSGFAKYADRRSPLVDRGNDDLRLDRPALGSIWLAELPGAFDPEHVWRNCKGLRYFRYDTA
jgi:hypothetical protein